MSELDKRALDEAYVAHFCKLFEVACSASHDADEALNRLTVGLKRMNEIYTKIQRITLED
jgi:hypothetical protein